VVAVSDLHARADDFGLSALLCGDLADYVECSEGSPGYDPEFFDVVLGALDIPDDDLYPPPGHGFPRRT
jgi:hypothetical protein